MGSAVNEREMPKKIKFIYFDARGRLEAVRLNMAYSGVEYEEVRHKLPFDPESTWSEFRHTFPWGTLPVLEVDGEVISQSMTIGRYVAQLTGMCGDTMLEQARYDAIVGACSDLFEVWVLWIFERDEKIKDRNEKHAKERLPTLMNQLENVLGNHKYFGGSKLSWADLQFYCLYETYKFSGHGFEDIFTGSEALMALIQNVKEIPQIKEYLKNRKFTQF